MVIILILTQIVSYQSFSAFVIVYKLNFTREHIPSQEPVSFLLFKAQSGRGRE